MHAVGEHTFGLADVDAVSAAGSRYKRGDGELRCAIDIVDCTHAAKGRLQELRPISLISKDTLDIHDEAYLVG